MNFLQMVSSKGVKINGYEKRGGLGSGMSSLFSSNEIEEKHSGGVLEVDINKITPNPKQPRNKFDDATLMELADSIKEVGVLQPITVKKMGITML